MRTLPLVLLAVAALVTPTAALAGGSATPTYRAFVITGLVLGDQKAEASGKLSIEGGQLAASVGCNLIGGSVSLDGDTVTITDSLSMTEMACPGTVGDLEAMLIKILARGPFRIGNGDWSGDAAQILVQELPSGNPDPNATAPDQPVTSSPGPVIVDPGFSCPPYPVGSGEPGSINGTVEPGGGPTSGSGSGGSSGSGSTGTGSGSSSGSSTGSGTTGTTVAPPPPDAGQTGDPGKAEPAPTGIDEVAPSPADAPVDVPAPSAVDAPAPSAIPVPDPGTGVGPTSTFDIDPGFGGKPVPSYDPCARMYAVDQGLTGGAIPPKTGDAAAEHAQTGSSNPNAPFVALSLAVLALAAVAVGTMRQRRIATPR